MTNQHPTNQIAFKQTNIPTATIDWTSLTAQCLFEDGQAFLKTISSADTTLDEAQLAEEEHQANQLLANALATAKRARTNPGPQLLSAIRNWARKRAIAILREKLAGTLLRQDFYTPFQFDLQQEFSTMILDLQRFWEQEDEQREAAEQQRHAARRKEAEQAYGAAYPYIQGLSEAVLQGERQRQTIFESGHQAAQGWANKYEESVRTREHELEARVKLCFSPQPPRV